MTRRPKQNLRMLPSQPWILLQRHLFQLRKSSSHLENPRTKMQATPRIGRQRTKRTMQRTIPKKRRQKPRRNLTLRPPLCLAVALVSLRHLEALLERERRRLVLDRPLRLGLEAVLEVLRPQLVHHLSLVPSRQADPRHPLVLAAAVQPLLLEVLVAAPRRLVLEAARRS